MRSGTTMQDVEHINACLSPLAKVGPTTRMLGGPSTATMPFGLYDNAPTETSAQATFVAICDAWSQTAVSAPPRADIRVCLQQSARDEGRGTTHPRSTSRTMAVRSSQTVLSLFALCLVLVLPPDAG